MGEADKKLLLLDANAITHRAFHALPPLTSPKGEMVNAIYGLATTLLRAIKDIKPDYLIACFDVGRHTFRNDIYPAYKAHRQETDHALVLQLPRAKEMLEQLSIPSLGVRGVEADDLIGTIARQAKRKKIKTFIVTGDKDSLQLVDEDVFVYSLHRGVSDTLIYDPQTVKEKMGITPEQVVDYKALSGDPSDNIPGVAGVGPKTAIDLLAKYGDIERIYQHLANLPERQRTLLEKGRKEMELSRRLALIKKDVPLKIDWPTAAVEHFDYQKAAAIFQEFGFRTLLSRLADFTAVAKTPLPGMMAGLDFTGEVVTSLEKWEKTATLLGRSPLLAVDTETVDLGGELVGISFATGPDKGYYLPIKPGQGGLAWDEVKPALSKLLGDSDRKVIGHNFKYDLTVLNRAGMSVANIYADTMLASQLLNSQLFSHKLDELALNVLKATKTPLTDLIGKGKDQPMSQVPLAKIAHYSMEDAVATWRLWQSFAPDLEEKALKKIFYEIEMPLLPVLEKMESTGVLIDLPYLKTLASQYQKALEQLEKKIRETAKTDFNPASPAQLKQVLFEQLKLSPSGVKKVKTGLSTDAETLKKLVDQHPVVPLILEYREKAKLYSTYIEALPKQADKQGRVHTSFLQLGAATGRLSSLRPNLQNIPTRTELGQAVRQAFIAGEDRLLVGADYSQAELRILAHISQEEHLIKAFQDGGDFHQSVADMLGVDRRTAKTINFGIVYGLGPVSLAEGLGVPLGAAKGFIDHYFRLFPGVRSYVDQMKERAREKGYAETELGRRRYLPDIHSPNPMLRSAAERMAINMPAQGTVADLMKLAMIEVDRQLPFQVSLLLQIHDELLLETPADQAPKIGQLVKKIMEGIRSWRVPLLVDVKIGKDWANLTAQK